MTHTLLLLNAFALSAVLGLALWPADDKAGTLEYRTSVQAHKAVLGQNPSGQVSQEQVIPTAHRNLSF